VGDGQTLDTASIQKAIDTAASAGGGTIGLRGGTFLSGTLVLKSNVALHIEGGAVLRGSRNIADYPDHTPQLAYLYRPRFTKALIYAEGAENIAFSRRGHDAGRPGGGTCGGRRGRS
jgi:polygalacturonase